MTVHQRNAACAFIAIFLANIATSGLVIAWVIRECQK